MRCITAVAVASAALLMGCGAIRSSKSLRDISGVQRHEAELLISFPIEGRFGAPVEPSGLTFHEGFLYTVSDEHDRSMFRLAMTVDTHVAEADLTLVEVPLQFSPGAATTGMDFAGRASARMRGNRGAGPQELGDRIVLGAFENGVLTRLACPLQRVRELRRNGP